MAEAAALAAAGWVASPLVTKLLNEGFDYLGGKGCCCLDAGIKDRLVKLETNILIQFQLVIEAAERSSEHKDRIEGWLRRLKDAFYEAEDVLDLYKYQLLKAKVSDLNSRPALKTFKKVARKVNMKLSIFSQIKLKKSLKKLEEIAAEAVTFRGQLGIQIGNDGMVARQRDLTTSFPPLPHKVFGRQTELGTIIEYLKSASKPEKRYSVITIVGIGGVGKTTLAQLVCKDEWVVNHFDIKIWVCVSRKLDLSRHTTQMIESSNEACSFRESLDAMQNKLAELVKSKKVLLVLDDVWWDESTSNTETEWETFLRPLATSVESGSKVLVTTRINNLPRALGPRPEYSMALKDLEENDILSLFKLSAFDGTNLDGSQQEELMKIGNQIVQKLYRSPLAAKTVACQLNRTLNVDAWRSALTRNNLGDSQQALLWSYQRLSAWLQRCFSYFRLFPKGHKYEAERMVHLWIAEGFIHSSNNSKRMEDIGMDYIDELVSGSFIQKDRNGYYMHDLFHDLAENVSKEDCFRIEDDDQFKEIPPTTRRLSIFCRRASEISRHASEINMNFNRLENLHTLIVEDGPRSSHVIDNLFAATDKFNKKLRVLMIDDVSRGTLTNLLANLKHLRFLSFHLKEGDEFVLPATLGKLYHLQVLDTSYSSVRLPRSAKNLINLRHYVCYFMNHRIGADNKALESLPDIGRLTSLQTLPNFVVKKEKGRDIGQLKNLNEIRGRLNISNLENVEGKDKAAEANLRAKSHLEQLHLKWDKDDDVESDLDMEVLEGLQPHPNLKELSIKGYKSPRYPSWLLHLTALTHLSQSLRFLELRDCPSISSLPEHLPQSLNWLYLWDCPSVSSLPEHLPQSLNRLLLYNCPSISSLPEHLPQSLKHLELHNCPSISSLPEHPPQSLKWLYLRDCPSISSLPEHLLQSLNRLYLWDCPSISSLPEHLPQSLNRLLLYNCPNISSLPKHLPQSLEKLYLHNCPSISSLPEYLPQSLISITIQQCQILEKRCRSPNGEDWPKIAHIPSRYISSRYIPSGEAV